MKLESDFSLIRDEGAARHPAYPSFVDEMKGRDYGFDAINDAWEWFKSGWDRFGAALFADQRHA